MSSAKIKSTSFKILMALKVMSSKLPIGVGTKYNLLIVWVSYFKFKRSKCSRYNFDEKSKSLELTVRIISIDKHTLISGEILSIRVIYSIKIRINCIENKNFVSRSFQNNYSNFFFAKLGSFSYSSLIKAFFLAFDPFLFAFRCQ